MLESQELSGTPIESRGSPSLVNACAGFASVRLPQISRKVHATVDVNSHATPKSAIDFHQCNAAVLTTPEFHHRDALPLQGVKQSHRVSSQCGMYLLAHRSHCYAATRRQFADTSMLA